MNARPQIIFNNGEPAFAVIPYAQFVALTGGKGKAVKSNDDELIPFVVSDYIKNPIRVARAEAGMTQQKLAKRLKVTQGYVSTIEGRNFAVTPALLENVHKAIRRKW